jgi:hypothetical protein
MKNVAGIPRSASSARIRRAPTRDPYSPCDSFPGPVSPSRSGMVS